MVQAEPLALGLLFPFLNFCHPSLLKQLVLFEKKTKNIRLLLANYVTTSKECVKMGRAGDDAISKLELKISFCKKNPFDLDGDNRDKM